MATIKPRFNNLPYPKRREDVFRVLLVYLQEITSLIRRKGFSKKISMEDEQDIVQDALMYFCKNKGKLYELINEEKIEQFCWRVVENLCLKRVQRFGKPGGGKFFVSLEDAHHQLFDHPKYFFETEEQLSLEQMCVLAELSDREKEVILRRAADGKKTRKEIADEMNIALYTYADYLKNAKKKLKKWIDENKIDPPYKL